MHLRERSRDHEEVEGHSCKASRQVKAEGRKEFGPPKCPMMDSSLDPPKEGQGDSLKRSLSNVKEILDQINKAQPKEALKGPTCEAKKEPNEHEAFMA